MYRDKREPGYEACHDTINCIMTGGKRGVVAGCVAIQHNQGCDMALDRGWVVIQNVYRDQKGHETRRCVVT